MPVDNDIIENFYTKYPYPSRDFEDVSHKSILPANIFAIDRYILGNSLSKFRHLNILIAGCGTGDAAVALINQTRELNLFVKLHCVDLSMASLKILKKRVNNIDSKNEIFTYCQSIEYFCENHYEEFDYIDFCGVLNHVEDPFAVMSALYNVLSDQGGIGVMAYGKYGREGIYSLQKAFLALNEHIELSIKDVRNVLKKVKNSHPFMRNPLYKKVDDMSDAEVADIFLNPRDRSFTVSEIDNICANSGLSCPNFIPEFVYKPEFLLGSGVGYIFQNCPEHLFPQLAEGFFGNIRKHCFFVTKRKEQILKPSLVEPELRFRLLDLASAEKIIASVCDGWLYMSLNYEGNIMNIKVALPVENKNLVSDIIIGKKFSSIFHDYEIQNYEIQKITEFIFKLEKVGIGFVSSV